MTPLYNCALRLPKSQVTRIPHAAYEDRLIFIEGGRLEGKRGKISKEEEDNLLRCFLVRRMADIPCGRGSVTWRKRGKMPTKEGNPLRCLLVRWMADIA